MLYCDYKQSGYDVKQTSLTMISTTRAGSSMPLELGMWASLEALHKLCMESVCLQKPGCININREGPSQLARSVQLVAWQLVEPVRPCGT